jgi:carboxylesterase type B
MKVLIGIALLAVASAQPEVETEYGIVRGQTITLDDDIQVNSFKAIPFARAPVGELRFEPPQKAEPWAPEVFNATQLGWACPQSTAGLVWMTHPLWIFYREDCLNVNIYTPENMSGGPYPVMVWFHGGGYTGGANIQYPGHFLASHDVVVVVPNYRLGAFGFLATPDGTLRGNAGMLDQVMALEFVRDNIANFGGDPNRVTVFGQSAGAGSSAMQMLSPLSQGLVHQGICESGADNNMWTVNWPEQKPEEYVYQTAEKVGCGDGSDPEIVDCMRSLNWTIIRNNQALNCTPGYFCQGYAPIMDGPGGFFPDYPDAIRESGNFTQGPLITGICRDDGSLYTLAYIPEADEGEGFTREEFLFYLEDRLLSLFADRLDEETQSDVLRAVDFYYTPWPELENLWENREAFNKLATDLAFGMAMDRQALWHSEVADTYTYIQGYRPLNASSFIPEWMGVPHNGELPFVWGYPRLLHNPAVREDSAMYVDPVDWTDPEDIEYTHYFQTMWTNFAKVGNPTPEPVPAPGSNEPTTWPKFTEEGREYLDVDEDIQILENYRPRNMAFWREYMPYLSGIPSNGMEKSMEKSTTMSSLNSGEFSESINQKILDAVIRRFGQEAVDEALNAVN